MSMLADGHRHLDRGLLNNECGLGSKDTAWAAVCWPTTYTWCGITAPLWHGRLVKPIGKDGRVASATVLLQRAYTTDGALAWLNNACRPAVCRWHDAASQTINFITEYFTSGNLRQ
jgi:hypothetical protein